MNLLDNRSFLVVGDSAGVGRATVESLLKRGAMVYGISRSGMGQHDSDLFSHLSFDVTNNDTSDLEAFMPEQLTGLIYCPGSITLKPFVRLTPDDFLSDFNINLLGAVRMIQAALPALKKGKPASIVLFSTVASQVGMNFHASISAAKSAVEGLGVSLAAEFAGLDIRVNVIAPSITQTPLAGQLLSTEEKVKASANRHPLKRIGQPSDMAALAAFLLSPESAWITGQVISVDGGLSSLKPL